MKIQTNNLQTHIIAIISKKKIIASKFYVIVYHHLISTTINDEHILVDKIPIIFIMVENSTPSHIYLLN